MTIDLRNAIIYAVLGVAATIVGAITGAPQVAWLGGVLIGLTFAWIAVWATTGEAGQ